MGFTNLDNHNRQSTDHMNKTTLIIKLGRKILLKHLGLASQKHITSMNGQAHCCIFRMSPISDIDNTDTCKLVNRDTIIRKTLRRYLQLICDDAAETINAQLPSKFGIIFAVG